MNIDILFKKHPNYDAVKTQADYLFRSYVGGEAYRAGQFLTKYMGEGDIPGAYSKRLAATPLDNHTQTTVDIYRSFIFKTEPHRELGKLEQNSLVNDWLKDTDQEGQGMSSFIKTMNDYAMVLGNVWILVDKPAYKVNTQAEEEALGIRGYACMYSPQNVLNWEYKRSINGKMQLSHISVIEDESSNHVTITHWYSDRVEKYTVIKNDQGTPEDITGSQVYENPLGYIPMVNHVPQKSMVRGVGQSIMADVADSQKYIYNLLSELEQTIRISSHPTLVKTKTTDANAGAGSIINLDDQSDPGLNPYLLQPTSSGINGILDTIEATVDAILRMSHTSAVAAVKTSSSSGISLEVERELLFAKLTDLADTIEETEYKMWSIWADWQGLELPKEFAIDYDKSYNIRNKEADLAQLKIALELNDDADFQSAMKEKIANMFKD